MSDLAAPHLLSLSAYEPGKPEDELKRELGIDHVVKLASNENPYGPSPRPSRRPRAPRIHCIGTLIQERTSSATLWLPITQWPPRSSVWATAPTS